MSEYEDEEKVYRLIQKSKLSKFNHMNSIIHIRNQVYDLIDSKLYLHYNSNELVLINCICLIVYKRTFEKIILIKTKWRARRDARLILKKVLPNYNYKVVPDPASSKVFLRRRKRKL